MCVCVCALVLCCVYKVCDEFSKSQQQLGEGAQHGMPTNESYTYSERVSSLSLSLSLSLSFAPQEMEYMTNV